jgi:iron complex transport system substrate-binding protein
MAMRVRACLVLTLALPFFLATASAADDTRIEVVDDAGSLVKLATPAQRIVSLAPSLTELVFAAGAGDALVGVVEYSDFPVDALDVPLIGRFDRFDIETILALKPDLVLAWQTGNPRATVERLASLGLTVYVAEPKVLGSIPALIETIGTLADTRAQADIEAARFRQRLHALQTRYATAAPVRVFFQVWDRPLMTSGGNELTHDLITLCGGVNVFGDLNALAPKVNLEAVLLRDPEVIIASGIDETRPPWLDAWQQWPSISAVRNARVGFIDPDLTQRHSPRVLDGAALMCEQIDSARQSR